ncbi:MAG: MurR/RpiR family transcriptional regulator [Erysipelothrix sp.]|nr:MurR/RpiR family transcriptional regulator [Erysipelothrix sp.]
MSSILKIKERMPSYTEGERRIAKYIIDHKEDVIGESSQVVAEKTKTSASSVVRFSKRLGYVGFTDLNLAIAADKELPEIDLLETIIVSNDDVHTMVQKAKHANQNTLSKTYKLLDERKLESSIEALTQADNIFIVGLGGSSIVAQDLYHKLTRINKKCTYTQDFHMLLTSLTFISKEDVSIAFSYSGETYEANLAQKQAKSKGATTVSITSNPRSSITKYSDYVLVIPQEEKELRLGSIASRFALLAISDLLYFGLAKNNLDKILDNLESSRELLKKLGR